MRRLVEHDGKLVSIRVTHGACTSVSLEHDDCMKVFRASATSVTLNSPGHMLPAGLPIMLMAEKLHLLSHSYSINVVACESCLHALIILCCHFNMNSSHALCQFFLI